jgi:tyrosine decarboxylase/aspartate 1-decarboxylase
VTSRPPLFDKDSLDLLRKALDQLEAGFESLPDPGSMLSNRDRHEKVLMEVASRLHENYPYFHPLYDGQMLKPPHPVARLAAALADWINPNNHALDGGRASSAMEKEAVAGIAAMFGWDTHLGHLCSGGTMANLEALWIAGQLRPEQKIAVSAQAHYTHQRLCQVLGLECVPVAADGLGRMDLGALSKALEDRKIGTVVATIGTTATGSVDPLPELLELRKRYGFRLHADAAYGGYFTLVERLAPTTRSAFDRLGEADSIVIDPHKHGLQPYGCGCVLFRDPAVGRFYKHDSPYTYFSSNELHLGEISLECSRPGAAAVALWATQKLLPLVRGGEFAQLLSRSRSAALALHGKIGHDPNFIAGMTPELDIVVWVPRAASVSECSRLSRRLFEEAAKRGLHLALATLPAQFFNFGSNEINRDVVTCLRSVLMKPEHLDWLDRIWEIIRESSAL